MACATRKGYHADVLFQLRTNLELTRDFHLLSLLVYEEPWI